VRTRVEKFARVPARSERGSMKMPGGWGGSPKPGWLRAHDAPPGHVLRDHVGKSAEELAERCRSKGIEKASTFPSEEAAEKLVSSALDQNRDRIAAWLRQGSTEKLPLDGTFSHTTGVTVNRMGEVSAPTGVRVVLIPNPKMKDGWQILTAFPN
jgi:hypothetical protein